MVFSHSQFYWIGTACVGCEFLWRIIDLLEQNGRYERAKFDTSFGVFGQFEFFLGTENFIGFYLILYFIRREL